MSKIINLNEYMKALKEQNMQNILDSIVESFKNFKCECGGESFRLAKSGAHCDSCGMLAYDYAHVLQTLEDL